MRPVILAVLVCAVAGDAAHAQAGLQHAEFLHQAAALYDDPPNVGICKAGRLTDATRNEVLDTVNKVRALSGLGPVVYDAASDDEVMSAALLMAANGKLSHTPPADWNCWSVLGSDGASHSNLTGGVISPYLDFDSPTGDVIKWLTETTNANPGNIAHRRWLLDPFLQKIAYGRVAADYDGAAVTDGAALKVVYDDETVAVSGDTVDWPAGDYPAAYFADGVPLSFAVVADKSHKFDSKLVDFSHATVKVTQRGGADVAVSDIAFDNDGSGVPDNLQFRTGPLKHGVIYDVTITGVSIGPKGKVVTRDYTYWFRIVD